MKPENICFQLATREDRLQYHPIRFLVLAILLLLFGCQPLTDRAETLTPSSGAQLFKSKCSGCHDPELALKEYRSAEAWHDTIVRMKKEHRADITRKEIDILVKYHIKRQQQEAAVFREKCEKCHPGKVFLKKDLNAEQTRAIIKRMQQKAGNTIEDKDIDIIVRYHAQSHRTESAQHLQTISGNLSAGRPAMKEGMELFAEKCSTCHDLDRALTVIKDPEVWVQTIKRMQHYSKGAITDQEVNELVDFHTKEQQKEIKTFKDTCTQCHDDRRIRRRSMSEQEWLATIRRMQRKAPQLIPDEKVNLLAAFFHRRELAMARIFYGKCRLCHDSSEGKTPFQNPAGRIDGIIVLGSEEFGQSFQIDDVNNLLAFHAERQDRYMQIYSQNCKICHLEGIPSGKRSTEKKAGKRARSEWISLIAVLQGLELGKEIQQTINTQIDYHIYRQ